MPRDFNKPLTGLEVKWHDACSLPMSPQKFKAVIEECESEADFDVNYAFYYKKKEGIVCVPFLHTLIFNGLCSDQKIQALIDAGANKNILDGNRHTPLVRAVICKSFEDVECLMEKGFDPDFPDGNGKTPRQYALELDESDYFRKAVIIRWGSAEIMPKMDSLASAASVSASAPAPAPALPPKFTVEAAAATSPHTSQQNLGQLANGRMKSAVSNDGRAAKNPESPPASAPVLELSPLALEAAEGVAADSISTPLLAPSATTPASNPTSPAPALPPKFTVEAAAATSPHTSQQNLGQLANGRMESVVSKELRAAEGVEVADSISTPLLAPSATTPASNPASPSVAAVVCDAISRALGLR
jgi:ankyrin repeat protein